MLPGVAGHDVAEAGAGLLCGRRCLLLRGEVALDEAGAEPPALGNGGPVLQRPLPNVGWFRCGMRRGCRRAFVGGDVLFPCALGLLRPADGGKEQEVPCPGRAGDWPGIRRTRAARGCGCRARVPCSACLPLSRRPRPGEPERTCESETTPWRRRSRTVRCLARGSGPEPSGWATWHRTYPGVSLKCVA